MALRVTSATQGGMRAQFVNVGPVPSGRITLMGWFRGKAATDQLRASLTNEQANRIILAIGTGTTLLPRTFGTNDVGGQLASGGTSSLLTLTPDVWAPVIMGFSNELVANCHRVGALRPGLLSTAPPGAGSSYLTLGGITRVYIGKEANAGSHYPGDYSHLALWNERLSDAEYNRLLGGENPLNIRRAALIGYWPLERDGRNLVQPAAVFNALDAAGPVWVDGPQGIAKPPVGRAYLRRSTAPAAVVGLSLSAALAGATVAASASRLPQRVALREAGFLALVRTLAAVLPGMPIERNRRSPIDDREQLPRLVVRDGGHETAEDEAAGEALYTVTATIEAYAKGDDDDALGQQLNELHAKIVAGLVGREITIDLDGRTTWPLEDSLELDDAPASQAEYHIGALYLTMRFDLRWPIGAGPFANI